ncbi:uncharacterized protein LOC113316217 [Papaver somniferum]|uniref:uncharacterized protein LOC113316217 n=1 Tax=Papaver somniferum TaxID=3469 RepID=UPI000E6F4B2F|nr:uncharacterized protein LOC113316217 [Papaver somniferum]
MGAGNTDDNATKRGCRKVKTAKAIKCFFSLPEPDNLLFCCDGASRGNPGNAGYGFIVRDNSGSFITAECGGLGISTNFIAEIMGALCAMEWDVLNQKEKIIINSDSTAAISAFMKNKLPWFVWNRWKFVSAKLRHIHFNHVYREVNFSADFFAKKGVHLPKGQVMKFSARPSNMLRMEWPESTYYRFE